MTEMGRRGERRELEVKVETRNKKESLTNIFFNIKPNWRSNWVKQETEGKAE